MEVEVEAEKQREGRNPRKQEQRLSEEEPWGHEQRTAGGLQNCKEKGERPLPNMISNTLALVGKLSIQTILL